MSEHDSISTGSGSFVEHTNINQSLSVLGTVIAALSSTSSSFVPYRNSKLTRLLKDSLGGNTKTTLLSMVGPTSLCADETMKTLRFSERATHVTQCAVLNELVSDATLLRRARLKIAQLQKELKAGLDNATEKREEREERMQRDLTNKSNQLRNSKRRIRQLEKQLESVRRGKIEQDFKGVRSQSNPTTSQRRYKAS